MRILVAAYFGVLASFASVFIFTFSVFLKPLATEFGWSRTEVSAGFALAAITVALASPAIGRLVDRFGSRAVILPAATVFAAAFASLGWLTPHLPHFYALMFLAGLVGNGTTQLAFSRAVVQAFDSRRGLALAVMLAGTGTGSMIMPPLAQAAIEGLGWRGAYRAFGIAIFLIVIPLTAWLIPHAGAARERTATRGAGSYLRTRLFLLYLGAFFLISLAVNAAIAHISPMLTDRGMNASAAALVASMLGAATLIGRLITGWLLDRWPATRVGATLFAASGLGLAILALARGPEWAYLGSALIGIGMGAEADLIPYLISRNFPLTSFSEMYGVAFSAFAVAGAAGPLILGRMFDSLGSYDAALMLMAVSALLASWLIQRSGLQQRPQERDVAAEVSLPLA